MIARILMTDVTRMSGDHVCVAGYQLEGHAPKACIRPMLRWESVVEQWLYAGKGVLRPFAIAEFDLLEHRPDPPHTEDWTVERRYRIVEPFAEELGLSVLEETSVASVQDLYEQQVIGDRGCYVPAGSGRRSLGNVRISRILHVAHERHEELNRWTYRLSFEDDRQGRYNLPVTDLAARYFLDHLRQFERQAPAAAGRQLLQMLQACERIYLRIGLTRPFGDRRDRCLLQVTAIHTAPDYLQGRCHVDYRPQPDQTPIVVPF